LRNGWTSVAYPAKNFGGTQKIWGLGALFGGAKPTKAPHGDGTGWYAVGLLNYDFTVNPCDNY